VKVVLNSDITFLPDLIREGLGRQVSALAEACRELGVPEASIVFVDTLEPPPAHGLRYGFKGSFAPDYPTIIWIFANWTPLAELRDVVRHEAAHLAFARTHPADESAGLGAVVCFGGELHAARARLESGAASPR